MSSMDDINFWICSFNKNDNGNVNYEAELKNTVRNLEDALMFYDTIDLNKNGFALFKDGIGPYEEDEDNLFKLTHGCVSREDKRKLLKECFETNVFSVYAVNGIYINERKFSIWLKQPCEIIPFKKIPQKKLTEIKNVRGAANLDRDWTLGFFDKSDFKINERSENGRDKQISTRFTEDLKRWIEKSYSMKQNSNNEKAGILLSSNIIPEKEWRDHHSDNRFIYTSIKVDLKRAKALWSNIVMNIVQTAFPKIPSIYLAFGFYENQTLKIGIYLTGKLRIDGCNHDKAAIIGYQIKMIIFKICDREATIRITNAIPSMDSNFTDIKYEHRVFEEI